MEFVGMVDTNGQVAPFTGAWIEMAVAPALTPAPVMSHPSRVRGLKCRNVRLGQERQRRTLHGCVD